MSKNKMQLFYIPTLLPSMNRWNSMYHIQKHKLKKEAQEIIYKAIKEQTDRDLNFEKVVLHFQCVLGSEIDYEITKDGKKRKKRNMNSRDIINNSPTIKLVEDCIVRSDILKDDTNEFVISHKIYADKVDREITGNGVIVMIEEVETRDIGIYKHFKDYLREKYKYDKDSKRGRLRKENKSVKQYEKKKKTNKKLKKIEQLRKAGVPEDVLKQIEDRINGV